MVPLQVTTSDHKTFTVSVCDKVVYDGKSYTFSGPESHAWRDSAVMVYDGSSHLAGMYVYVNVCVYACTYVLCICECMYVCMYVCVMCM